ncbi:MAG: 30S ribosomal protein S2 [Elusimicrobiota bacterium]
MFNVSMKSMLEAGVHFGHQTYKWNPKMSRFIFGERNGIHIMDLQKTLKELKKAYSFVEQCAKEGKNFLFVGTKKQAKEIIKEEAQRANVPCVYEKWLGGTLTNFDTIRKSLRRLEELEEMENKGYFKVMAKKEVSRLTKEKNKILKVLSGIREMKVIPDVMFIVDPVEEALAVKEAKKLGIVTVAVCDTNADPEVVDWVIPGNDDAARSIRLFCSVMADAVVAGRDQKSADAAQAAQEAQEAAASEEAGGQDVMQQQDEDTVSEEEQAVEESVESENK